MYTYALSRGLTIGSVSLVAVINILFEAVVKAVARWEHSHTLSVQSATIMSKVFLGIFLNTAFIIVVVNAKIPGLDHVLTAGQFSRADPQWYGKVGASLTLTMILVRVSPTGIVG